jgi:small subunit ribosomal protein S1
MSNEETKQAQGEAQKPQDESFAALLQDSELSGAGEEAQPGARVRGSVIHISEEYAFVGLGGKAEGVISVPELKNDKGELTVKVGDNIDAYVVSNQGGQIRLSRTVQAARGSDKRAAVEEAYKSRLPVEGTVTGRNKGGFDVQILGMRAFCPVSQIEQGFVENLDQFVGKPFRFRITEFKEGGRSIVVSRAALLKEEAAGKADQILQNLKAGDIFEGEVRSLRDFGAFVDIGGLEGLVHVSEISWGRVNHPKDVLSVGQKVKVKVVKVEDQAGKKQPRIGLTLRGLENSPWDRIGTDFKDGESYEGVVVRLAPFGAFVELAPGLDGLVHVSEMSWGRRINHPQDVVSVGDRVKVAIQSVDRDSKRISLSMKSTEGDPWSTVAERYAAGQQVSGKVEKVAPFGVFVALDGGITALLPNSESDVRDPGREFPPGAEVTAQILEIDPTRRRLTLSRKALNQREESENVAAYRAEPRPDRAAVQVDRSEKSEGSRRRAQDRGREEKRDYEEDDFDSEGGFGSLGDLIRAKNSRKRR